MSGLFASTRDSHRARLLPILAVIALMITLLAPLAADAAQDGTEPPVDQPAEELTPEEAAPATEVPAEAATEVATEAAAPQTFTLTLNVFRCNHPEFDTGLSSNIQQVIDTCTGPGYGTFNIESTMPVPQQSGQVITVEIGPGLVLQELVPPGYDNPIADCFLYGPDGNLADQIGPGETSGGGWKVGSVAGDVTCNWYQVDRGVGNVYVVNMGCPATAGLFPEPSYDDLVAMCTEPVGQKQFFVEHGAGLERMVPSGGEFNDALFEAVQTGPIAIRMEDHGAYDKARVFCQVFGADQITQVAPFSEVSVSTFRATGLTLVHGQRIHCSWFNIKGMVLGLPDEDLPDLEEQPTTAATEPVVLEPSELIIEKYTCPEGYDPEAAGADPFTDCAAGPDGVNFTLSDTDPQTVDLQTMTGDSIPNAVRFGGITPGDYTITETVPTGTAAMFVLGCGGGGGVDPVPQFIDGVLTTSIAPGVILTCPWFNIAGEGGQSILRESTAQALAGDTGRIVIQNYDCPNSPIDPGLGLDAVLALCVNRLEGVPMSISGEGGYTGSDTSNTTGTVIFEDVPVGNAFITANEMTGYGDSAVFCNTLPAEQRPFMQPTEQSAPPPDQAPPYEQMLVTQRSISYMVQAGHEVSCLWFNVPTGALVESPTQSAPGTGTSSITITKYACPAGFDVATVDANPQAQCAPLAGISFDIDDELDDGAGWYIESGADGTGTVSGLAAGRYTIEEGVPNGTTATFVWDCYEVGGSSNLVDPIVIGSVVQLDLPNDYQVHCDWYNVTGGTVRVVINKHACDYLVPAYTLTLEQLAAQCTIDTGTINFTVGSGTHQETQPASNDPLTLASFANVPSGFVAVVEDLPDGWAMPIVHCQVLLEDGTPVSPYAEMGVFLNRQIVLDLEAGQVASCEWYNVAQGFVDVHVTKHACPEGFDAYGTDLTGLVTSCTDDPGSVEFLLEDGSLYAQTRTATATTVASFTDVPSGQLRINETMPDGYGLPVVWCRIDLETGGNLIPAQPISVTNGSFAGTLSIYHDVSAGQVLYCDWFNVRGGAGSVSIWKEGCPEGFDARQATRLELENGCNEPIGTVDFALTSGSYTDTASSTNLFRYANFPGVPAGAVSVTETSTSAYDLVIVYCRVQEEGKPVTAAERIELGPDRTLEWDLGPNQWLICEWYNAHDTGSTVVVKKFDCPEGTTYDHDSAWYGQNCTTPHNGIQFTLNHSGGASMMATANGEATWNGVPLGPVSIQEQIPEEYGDPVVFCGVVSSSGGPIDAVAQPVEAEGGYVETRFDYPRTSYLCYWYNIPAGPSDITIYKYTCPEGYDLHAAGADPRKDCTEPTNGIRFHLGGPATDLQSDTGGSINGAATFGDLEPGAYTVTETVPDGTAYVFVLDCYGQRMGELRPYPLSMGDTLEIALSAGESVECYWYNVPDHDQGRLTVIKYECSTKTYVSDVDCEVYEDGQTFDLVFWDGDSWQYHSTQVTDGVGRSTWSDLEPGPYWLDEHDRDWCHLSSDWLSDDGNWLEVNDDEETIVRIYNCTDTPGKPGKTPTKYPNTGVPPVTAPSRETS